MLWQVACKSPQPRSIYAGKAQVGGILGCRGPGELSHHVTFAALLGVHGLPQCPAGPESAHSRPGKLEALETFVETTAISVKHLNVLAPRWESPC